MDSSRYSDVFQAEMKRLLANPLYQGKRLIPFDDTTVFTGPLLANATQNYDYEFRQKSDFIIMELRHSADSMAPLLTTPPQLRLIDTRINVPIIPVALPTVVLMGTAASGIPLVVPLLVPGGTLWTFQLTMSPDTVVPGFTPKISIHGIRIPLTAADA